MHKSGARYAQKLESSSAEKAFIEGFTGDC